MRAIGVAPTLALLTAAAALLGVALSNHIAAALHSRPVPMALPEQPRMHPPSADGVRHMARVISWRNLFNSDPPAPAPDFDPPYQPPCGYDPAFVRPVGSETFAVNQAGIEAYHDAIRGVCLKADMYAEPYGMHEVIGYRIWSRRSTAFLRRMGLCDGDILLASDEGWLSSPTKVFELGERLSRAMSSPMTIRLIREGTPLTLTYVIDHGIGQPE